MTRPPRPRAAPTPPRQPFPPAHDYVAPIIDIEDEPPTRPSGTQEREPDEIPFELESEHVPTMQSLSRQIGGVDRRLTVVHREVALTRREVADLRSLVTTDHAPRITQVEAKASRITIPPAAKAGSIGAGAGGLVVLAVEVLWPLLQQLIRGQ